MSTPWEPYSYCGALFAHVLADGQVPSPWQVKPRLHCGTDKAPELGAHPQGVLDSQAVAEDAAA